MSNILEITLGIMTAMGGFIDVSELVILVRTRRPLQLHVADIVARFDDDPPMQMDLETESGLAHILTFDT